MANKPMRRGEQSKLIAAQLEEYQRRRGLPIEQNYERPKKPAKAPEPIAFEEDREEGREEEYESPLAKIKSGIASLISQIGRRLPEDEEEYEDVFELGEDFQEEDGPAATLQSMPESVPLKHSVFPEEDAVSSKEDAVSSEEAGRSEQDGGFEGQGVPDVPLEANGPAEVPQAGEMPLDIPLGGPVPGPHDGAGVVPILEDAYLNGDAEGEDAYAGEEDEDDRPGLISWEKGDTTELNDMFGELIERRRKREKENTVAYIAQEDANLSEEEPFKRPSSGAVPDAGEIEMNVEHEEERSMATERGEGANIEPKDTLSSALYQKLEEQPSMSRRQRRALSAQPQPEENEGGHPAQSDQATRLFRPIRPEEVAEENLDEEPVRPSPKKAAPAKPVKKPVRIYDEDEEDYDEDYDDDDDDYEDEEDDGEEEESKGIGGFFLGLVRTILIIVLVLALAVIALRQLEAMGRIRLTAIRSILPPVVVEHILPEPQGLQDTPQDDPLSLADPGQDAQEADDQQPAPAEGEGAPQDADPAPAQGEVSDDGSQPAPDGEVLG